MPCSPCYHHSPTVGLKLIALTFWVHTILEAPLKIYLFLKSIHTKQNVDLGSLHQTIPSNRGEVSIAHHPHVLMCYGLPNLP